MRTEDGGASSFRTLGTAFVAAVVAPMTAFTVPAIFGLLVETIHLLNGDGFSLDFIGQGTVVAGLICSSWSYVAMLVAGFPGIVLLWALNRLQKKFLIGIGLACSLATILFILDKLSLFWVFNCVGSGLVVAVTFNTLNNALRRT